MVKTRKISYLHARHRGRRRGQRRRSTKEGEPSDLVSSNSLIRRCKSGYPALILYLFTKCKSRLQYFDAISEYLV